MYYIMPRSQNMGKDGQKKQKQIPRRKSNRKLNKSGGRKMKKMMGFLIIIVFCVFPLFANAGIIGDVTLSESYNWPAGHAAWNNVWGDYYLDYHASLNGGPYGEAFCVENADGPGPSPSPYTLLSIDSGLSTFGLDALRYSTAAWVAQNYYLTQKAAAQIAIWEIIYDGEDNFDLTSGAFKSLASGYGDWNPAANAIWAAIPKSPSFPTYSNQWALAVSPRVQVNGTVREAYAQNYLVQHVPEPTTLFLLGLGLVGLAGIRRKMA